MKRPFFNDSIIKLETEFEDRLRDKEFLTLLAEELTYRSTDRAKKLNAKVLSALNSLSDKHSSKSPEAVSSQKIEQHKKTLADYQEFSLNQDNLVSPSNIPTDVLSAWIALEVLSPQIFKKPQDLVGANGSIVYLNNSNLPWEGQGERSKPNYKLYYQIVLGTINFERAVESLLNIYADQRIERPSSKGEAVLAVVVVDSKGKLVEDPSAYISSFGWGLSYALKGNLKELFGWPVVEDKLRSELDKILRRTNEKGEELPINSHSLKLAKNYLESTMEIPMEFITNSVFAILTYQYYTIGEPPEPIFLNSFYIKDLISAIKHFKENKASYNLQLYLGTKQTNNRKDLLHDKRAFEQAVAPFITPPARWPSNGRHPLVALQQAAVNLAFNELNREGILGVNGPPGTGKTTLLRDILAGIVANRAEAMLNFEDPSEAFESSGQRISAGQAWLTLYNIDNALKGFEILIASSNNKAVENVSAELPGQMAIAEDISDLRYFTSVSDALLERRSWGLIAAVLGNAINRAKFKQKFWWDKDYGMLTYLAEASETPQFIDIVDEKGKITGTRKPKIIIEEDAPSSHDEALRRWKIVKDKFKTVLEKSQSQLKALEKIRELVINLPSLEASENSAEALFENSVRIERLARSNAEASSIIFSACERSVQEAKDALSAHQKGRPGFFARLFGTAKAKLWKEKNLSYQNKINAAQEEFKSASNKKTSDKEKLSASSNILQQRKKEFSEASRKVLNAKRSIEEARSVLGVQIIDANFLALPHQQKHLVSPWFNKKTQLIRDDVFIEAIRLHKAFIDAAAKPIRHNLGVLMKILSGPAFPDKRKQDLLPDLWSTLFLVVPAVSTTFASVERMLGKLSPESLGWLLIDEAGQALPQAAVGAIMRSKRAVIVGDPLQIEPVVTLPNNLTKSICRQFQVDPDRFNAPKASAQTLADAATPYHAVFEGRTGSRSVGVPLLVHRRCDDPMFSISNAIAYERLMVQAKKAGNSPIQNFLGPSRWIDITGRAIDKWSPEEGEIVLDILRRLRSKEIAPDLYIITPFVIVADNLRKIIRESGLLESWVDNPHLWPHERIGTVHTVQGREAEAVIFVLGAPLSQQTGARSWAGGYPNLINVAVTRAKEALYVIGNRSVWQNAGLFSELSSRLP